MSGRHRKPARRVWPVFLMPLGAAGVLWQAPADPPPAPVVEAAVLHQPPATAQPVVRRVVAQRVPPLAGAHGLVPNAQALADYIQQSYPEVPSIGGVRPCDGYNEHCRGVALDVMVDDPVLGDRIAADMLTRPDVKYIIWKQQIRYPSGYWRVMEDRGSPTANHYNHVHVAVAG